MSVMAMITAIATMLSVMVILIEYAAFRRACSARSRALAEALSGVSGVLEPGVRRLHGIARKRPGSDDTIASGRHESHMVTERKQAYWARASTEKTARPFDLELDDGSRVRVVMKGEDWTLRTSASEANSTSARVVEYSLRDGERVTIEGTLEERPAKPGHGFRDVQRSFRLVGRPTPLQLWTPGALDSCGSVRFMPPGLTLFLWGLSAVMVPWSISVALSGFSVAPGEGSVFIGLGVVLMSSSIAVVIAGRSGGWIGGRPWFERKE